MALKNPLIIGTRGSDLALWQANFVLDLLKKNSIHAELKIIKTKGDNIQNLGFDKMEGKGFFTKEIEDALLEGSTDLAVHSHKDLETDQPHGLIIAAVSSRADARELLLVNKTCVDLTSQLQFKKGSIVGTSSARRKAQLLDLRADTQLKDIRGNVPTRINKLREGEFDAILLAKAGVDRLQLNLDGLHVQVLDEDLFVPAPAQGVLAIQCRTKDVELVNLLEKISNPEVKDLISIERNVLNRLQGGCQLPLGIFAKRQGEKILVEVSIAGAWNSPVSRFKMEGNDAASLTDQILQRIQQ